MYIELDEELEEDELEDEELEDEQQELTFRVRDRPDHETVQA